MAEEEKGIRIAYVVCGEFPGGSLGDFIIWRAKENERMELALREQRQAFFDLQAGATKH